MLRCQHAVVVVVLLAAACDASSEPEAVSAPPAASAVATSAGHPSKDLIPRDVFVGNPDGKWLSWLQPEQGVLNASGLELGRTGKGAVRRLERAVQVPTGAAAVPGLGDVLPRRPAR